MNDFFIRWSVFIVIRLTMRAAVGSVILSQWFFLFYIRRHTMTTERTDEEQPFPSFAESRFSIREGDGLQTRTWRHGHSGGSFHCVLCGEQAYNHEFVSTTIFDGQQMLGDICDECVKAGPVLVGNRIRTHAADPTCARRSRHSMHWPTICRSWTWHGGVRWTISPSRRTSPRESFAGWWTSATAGL